ncbi:MAG: hypothetical protein GF317_05940 [Candidatus Lokiarchaeota archaeon]|nr:hypothetical protein [Candidatus Lokiarchaeota archaeon]
MLLSSHKAFNTIKKILEDSKEFTYIISAWIGRLFAKMFRDKCHAEEVVIIIRDDTCDNKYAFDKYLKHMDVRTNEYIPIHNKILITENYLVKGSGNFTKNSVFFEVNNIEFVDRNDPSYPAYYKKCREIIDNASPFISTLSGVAVGDNKSCKISSPNLLSKSSSINVNESNTMDNFLHFDTKKILWCEECKEIVRGEDIIFCPECGTELIPFSEITSTDKMKLVKKNKGVTNIDNNAIAPIKIPHEPLNLSEISNTPKQEAKEKEKLKNIYEALKLM